MENIILTIGIPTYNRQEMLKKCLDRLIKENLDNNIEILISDNGSIDGTKKLIDKYTKLKLLKLNYLRNNYNMGFDQNVINLYKHAKGKYIWFLSDDDVMLPNAINKIVKILRLYKLAAVHPNHLDQNKKLLLSDNLFLDIVRYFPTGIGMRIKTGKKLYLKDEIERMSISRSLSFISNCIVKVDRSIIKCLNQFDGTGIMQDAIVNLCLLKNPTIYISKTPSIMGGGKEYFSKWFMMSTIFGVRKLYTNKLFQYSKTLSQRVSINNCKFALIILAQVKILKIPIHFKLTLSEIYKIIKTYRFEFIYLLPYIIFVYVSKLIPKKVLSNIYKIGYFVAKKLLKD